MSSALTIMDRLEPAILALKREETIPYFNRLDSPPPDSPASRVQSMTLPDAYLDELLLQSGRDGKDELNLDTVPRVKQEPGTGPRPKVSFTVFCAGWMENIVSRA
jgi:hypothetical protein